MVSAVSISIPPTPVSAGAVPRWVPVGFRGRGLPGSGGTYDTTNTAVLDVSAHWAPSFGGVRALKVLYSGADLSNTGPVDRPNTVTANVALSLPSLTLGVICNAAVPIPSSGTTTTIPLQIAQGSSGNGASVGQVLQGTGIPTGAQITVVTPVYVSGNLTSYSVTINALITSALTAGQSLTLVGRNFRVSWGGINTGTFAPCHRFYTSDPVGLPLAAGAQFFVRGAFSFSSAAIAVADYPSPSSGSTRLSGEGSNRSTAFVDHSMDQTVPANSGGGYWAPPIILGQVNVPTASVLIVGDSIAAGTGDAADTAGRMGYIQRSLAAAVPWASIARGSTSALQMAANPSLLYDAVGQCSTTDVLLEYCRNDLNASSPQSAAQVQASLAAISAPLIGSGIRVWVFTCPPTTCSQDAWASLAGQFLVSTSTTTSAAAASGATTLTVTSGAGISSGQSVSLSAGTAGIFQVGTTVTSVSGTTVTLSAPLTGGVASGATLSFGTRSVSSTATPIEYQREAYNSAIRSGYVAAGYSGLIDIDATVHDASTAWAWRTDLGAASAEGIHPAAVLHNKLVSAGLITPSMFPVR